MSLRSELQAHQNEATNESVLLELRAVKEVNEKLMQRLRDVNEESDRRLLKEDNDNGSVNELSEKKDRIDEIQETSSNGRSQEIQIMIPVSAGPIESSTKDTSVEGVPEEISSEVLSGVSTEAHNKASSEVSKEVLTEVPSEKPIKVPNEASGEMPSEAPSEMPKEAITKAPSEAPSETLPNEVPAGLPLTTLKEPSTQEYASVKRNISLPRELSPSKQAHVSTLTLPILKLRLRYAYKRYLPNKEKLLKPLFKKIGTYNKSPQDIFMDLCRL